MKIAAALALGLATGLLIGLSSSELVAAVVTALVALATTLVALGGPALVAGKAPPERDAADDAALVAFAGALVIAVLAGLYVRTHDLLSPSPEVLTARWEAAGFSSAEARRIASHTLRGIDLGDGTAPLAATGPAAASATARSVLFSGEYKSRCASTDPTRAPDRGELLNTWSLAGEPWQVLSVALTEAPDGQLMAVWSALCDTP